MRILHVIQERLYTLLPHFWDHLQRRIHMFYRKLHIDDAGRIDMFERTESVNFVLSRK